MTPGASGGLDVCEFVLTFLLGAIIGKNCILPLTVVHCGITIADDFLAYVIAVMLQNRKKLTEKNRMKDVIFVRRGHENSFSYSYDI